MYRLFILSLIGTELCAKAQPVAPPDEPGLRPAGMAHFPAPEDSKPISLPGSDMETQDRPPGFIWGRCERVKLDDAPQGKHVCRIPLTPRVYFGTPRDLELEAGRPYLLSLWLKSPQED
jgi:hypothetical protein